MACPRGRPSSNTTTRGQPECGTEILNRDLYRLTVAELERVPEGPNWAEAMDLIRSMVDRVDMTPRADDSGVDAVLHGDLAAILAACGEAGAAAEGRSKSKLPGAVERPGSQLSLVARTRNQRYLHPLLCRVPLVPPS